MNNKYALNNKELAKVIKQQKENEEFNGSEKQYQYNTDFRAFLR